MKPTKTLTLIAIFLGLLQAAGAQAEETAASATPDITAGPSSSPYRPDMGRLLATQGVSSVEGPAGGGITPWALIAGYGTRDSYGANVHYSTLRTQDFGFDTAGVAVGLFDRVELSVATQNFRARSGPLDSLRVNQDIIGVKVRLFGNLVYDQDDWMPQVSIGAEYKHNNGLKGLLNAPVTALGAKSDSGTDFYISATKLFLSQSLLANVTLRETKANQMGLLGFGGDLHNSYSPEFEGSLAYLLSKNWAIGAEYRTNPHNLSADNQKDYYDAFVAYFPTKNISITAAYVNLGSIVAPVTHNNARQNGFYLSLQAGF
ncbi:MAG: DUF3034 family protein [Burkholderiales bacterium]|nr:DUF3034 family protein [Burkholderiales bacterium]MDE2287252.1 DUF3034 family protein [Burkholderiales bacterium]MDE2608773.1 DUF3034 family protein [Burkholderiales bacterium]